MLKNTSSPAAQTLTIGHLARSAGAGVGTIRYDQQRGLLPVPEAAGAYRRYPIELGERIRFVKRAQEFRFSSERIAELVRLEDGTDRSSESPTSGGSRFK